MAWFTFCPSSIVVVGTLLLSRFSRAAFFVCCFPVFVVQVVWLAPANAGVHVLRRKDGVCGVARQIAVVVDLYAVSAEPVQRLVCNVVSDELL